MRSLTAVVMDMVIQPLGVLLERAQAGTEGEDSDV